MMFLNLRPVVGHEGWYLVGYDGRIWSRISQRWLVPRINNMGYLYVDLARPGSRSKRHLVHRVVATAWLPTPAADQTEVNHKDSNRRNPHMGNLEWCTPSQNHRHAWKHGKQRSTPLHQAAARRNGKRRLTDDQVRAVRAALRGGASNAAIGEQYGVSATTIFLIHHNRRYAGI